MARAKGYLKNSMIFLENPFIKVSFDKENGTLWSLTNKRTGKDYILKKEIAQIFRLIVPLEDWLGHHIDASDQKLDSYEIKKNKEIIELVFKYSTLKSIRGSFDIDLKYGVRISEDNKLNFWINVKNDSDIEITEIWFPWISGFQKIGEDPEKDCIVVPEGEGQKIKCPLKALYPKYSWISEGGGRPSRFLWRYPRLAMQWLDFYTENEGLYFGYHENSLRMKTLLLQREITKDVSYGKTPNYWLSLAWIRYPHQRKGEVFESENYIAALHEGDWHRGADIYKDWLRTWLKPCKVSDRIRESIGWHFSFVMHGDRTPILPYEEIPKLFESAKKAGIFMLQLFGFHKWGMDTNFPSYEPIESLGGLKGLQDAMDKIRAQNGLVALYMGGCVADLLSKPYSKQIIGWATKDRNGVPRYWHWGWTPYSTNKWAYERTLVYMCPSSGWSKLLVEKAIQFVRDYHATSVHIDHIGSWPAWPCYDEKHDHEKPDEAFEVNKEMFREMRSKIKEIYPDATIDIEGISEQYGQWVDIFWTPISIDFFPEVMRYTIPQYLFTTMIQENEYDKAAKAFVYGLLFDIVIELGYGKIDEYPDFCEYIAKFSRLKMKLKDYLVNSNFKDDVGIRVTQGIVAKIYESENGIAILMFNPTDQQIEVKLELDHSTLDISRERCKIELYNLDGLIEEKTSYVDEIMISMKSKELIALTIRK